MRLQELHVFTHFAESVAANNKFLTFDAATGSEEMMHYVVERDPRSLRGAAGSNHQGIRGFWGVFFFLLTAG